MGAECQTCGADLAGDLKCWECDLRAKIRGLRKELEGRERLGEYLRLFDVPVCGRTDADAAVEVMKNLRAEIERLEGNLDAERREWQSNHQRVDRKLHNAVTSARVRGEALEKSEKECATFRARLEKAIELLESRSGGTCRCVETLDPCPACLWVKAVACLRGEG